MTEVDDLFFRSLRNSTRRGATADATVGHQGNSPKYTPASWVTGRHSTSGETPAVAAVAASSVPPDLLANLTPRTLSNDDGVRCSSSTSTTSSSSSTVKKIWNSVTTKKPTKTTPIKEYQVVHRLTSSSSGEHAPLRRHNCLQADNVLTSQVRIVPTWFPPATISRLKRGDSFHGETIASRLFSAKQRVFRPQRDTMEPDAVSCPRTIMEEPEGIISDGRRKPIKSLSPVICPRHAKHHSSSPFDMPKSATTSSVNASSASPGKKSDQIDADKSQCKPKSVFKFGTLPRSFKVSGTGRSSPSPLASIFRPLGSPTPFAYTSAEAPRTAPVLLRRNNSLRKSRNRNSWHVTVPVARPDVSLSEDKAWFDPVTLPNADQKLCTCGDTRKHVHLVNIAPDLTLMDTRYFVAENGDEIAEPDVQVIQTHKDIRSESNEPDFCKEEGPDTLDTWDSNFGECYHDFTAANPGTQTPEPDMGQILEEAVCSAHQEIDAISTHDKSMLRKLLDMSDQIRHWTGSRKHRIRSVDSSPILASLNSVTSKRSLGNFPPLSDMSITEISEELRLSRTYSMESLHFSKHLGQMAQVDDSSPAVHLRAKNSTEKSGDPLSSSLLRTNMHLSYSDLLKNSSKFWQQPSQPGSLDSTNFDSKTKFCVLREASLSLLL